ncbi:MAG: GSCFA domain-containing protein [Rhodobacterales bacterium]|nr:GSCFA domain-containing protein [Rhodobacterales bacterium]
MAPHPYKGLPDHQFWKRAVAEVGIFDLRELYSKKFDILPQDPIVTAGSCFAQHIAHRLQNSGYHYLDTEPAPPQFPSGLLEEFGYGLYSARFGNVYTARQLLQLAQRAFGAFDPVEHLVEHRGRVFDLLRPSVEPRGFASRDEAEAMLAAHLGAVRRMFEQAGVFIFTFGLTEAWVDRRDGTTYPVCPGTAAGEFDPEKYAFKNFGYTEIMADMQAVIAMARAVNPGLKFLLTVSPVPLVATALPQHVLVSTTYSKSVLRAVAGDLESSDPLIDYFPSYEIICGIPSRSMFYLPDMRSVHPRGVDVVMTHFFDQHPPVGTGPTAVAKIAEDRDPVCDELVLEQN